MIARLYPRSLLAWMFFALAAALVAVGLTACGKSEDKPASPPPPAATTPSGEAPKSPAGVPGAVPASTPIGRIDALDGDVRIVGATAERRAQAGTQIQEGDTVKVGADSWALLEMSDGASVTMRPDSELRFDRYRYAPDGEANRNSAVMSLARGAFRSITGYIGRTNRSGYQIQTGTATIGIRGTDHEPAYYPPPAPGGKSDRAPGTYDKVNEGESVIRRPTGEVSVKRGQTAFAHYDIKVRPQLLPAPPAFYQQHAQIDKNVAVRRTEFHRRFEQQQQRLQQERKQQQQTLKKEQEQRKDSKQPEQRKDKKQLEQRKDKKQQDQKDKQQKQAEQRDKKQAEQKGKKPQDEKKQPERKGKDEKKSTLPPSAEERIKNMQRGDKNTSPQQQQRQQLQQQQQRQQPSQQQRQQPQQQQQTQSPPVQQRQPPQQQQQRQQPQQQNQGQQAQQLREKAKKKPEPPSSQR